MHQWRQIVLGTLLAGAAPLLAQTPAAGGLDLNVHLNLTDSVRSHLKDGTIRKISVVASAGRGDTVVGETDTDSVTLHGLTPGQWTLRELLAFPKVAYLAIPEGTEVNVTSGSTATVTVDIPGVVVSGKTLSHGAPFKGQMTLTPIDASARSAVIAVPFDENGQFVFLLPKPGRFDLQLTGHDHSTTPIPGFDFSADDATHPVTIQLAEGVLTGKVLDANGNPMPRTRVKATLSQKVGAHPVTASATTGPDGSFALQGLVGGRWSVESHGRFAATPVDVVLPDGGRKEVVLQSRRPDAH